MASTRPRRQSAALNSWIRAHLFLLFAHKMRSQRPQRGPSCCTSAGMLCVWQCRLLEGGSGVLGWDGSSALNRVCFSGRVGGVGVVPAGPRRSWAAGGRWVGPWVLGPLWWGESAGGPQPALPLFRHFPVRRRLVLVPPLLPLEEAELGGRTDGQKWRTDV